MFSRNATPSAEETVWEVSVSPANRARLVDRLRQDLGHRLGQSPDTRTFAWETPLGIVNARLVTGAYRPGLPIRFSFAEPTTSPGRNGSRADGDCPLPRIALPDHRIAQKTEGLVGLNEPIQEILAHFRFRWDMDLQSQRTNGLAVPTEVQRYFAGSSCLFVLAGRPGTGKTATAEGAVDQYCREAGVAGTIVKVTTAVRGQGLVGQFSQQVHKAFETARRLPEDELKVLLLDEADALASRRSAQQQHQEDKAATSSILQAVDGAASTNRFAILMTTNLVEDLDPAILRRATVIYFYPPSPKERGILLCRWLGPIRPRDLKKAVSASDGMTGADIERALARAWIWSYSAGELLDIPTAIRCLTSAARTEDV